MFEILLLFLLWSMVQWQLSREGERGLGRIWHPVVHHLCPTLSPLPSCKEFKVVELSLIFLWKYWFNEYDCCFAHCKYIRCIFYSFKMCLTFHCNLTVWFTINCCSKYSGIIVKPCHSLALAFQTEMIFSLALWPWCWDLVRKINRIISNQRRIFIPISRGNIYSRF